MQRMISQYLAHMPVLTSILELGKPCSPLRFHSLSLHPRHVIPHVGHAPFFAGDTMVVAKRPVKEAEAERTVEQKRFEPK